MMLLLSLAVLQESQHGGISMVAHAYEADENVKEQVGKLPDLHMGAK